MKYTVFLFLSAICLAQTFGQDERQLPNQKPSGVYAFAFESQHPVKRVARQYTPPDLNIMTAPPKISTFEPPSMNRKRREARGVGGSMPTRKG